MKTSENEKPKTGFQAFSALEWDKIKASRRERIHGEELIALAKVRISNLERRLVEIFVVIVDIHSDFRR